MAQELTDEEIANREIEQQLKIREEEARANNPYEVQLQVLGLGGSLAKIKQGCTQVNDVIFTDVQEVHGSDEITKVNKKSQKLGSFIMYRLIPKGNKIKESLFIINNKKFKTDIKDIVDANIKKNTKFQIQKTAGIEIKFEWDEEVLDKGQTVTVTKDVTETWSCVLNLRQQV